MPCCSSGQQNPAAKSGCLKLLSLRVEVRADCMANWSVTKWARRARVAKTSRVRSDCVSRSWLPRHVTWRAAASDFLPREATLAHLARSGIPPLAYHVVKMLL